MKEIRLLVREVLSDTFLNEGKEDKIAVLIDGTSSAGKSMTANLLDAVPFYEATDPNQWVVIDSDHFGANDTQGIENRIKYDHAGDGPNKNAGEEFHKEMAQVRKGKFFDDGKTKSGDRGMTTIGFPKHPHNKDVIDGTDWRNWYMAQEYKYGGWKKVIFDDIGNGILKYVPNVKNILLHAPIHVLMQNIDERNKRGKEPRKHEDVLGHYLEKYEATKSVPDEEVGHSVPIEKNDLEDKLLSSGVSEEFTKEFFNKLGMDSDGKYYIKIRDEYLNPGVQLINVDSERTSYLDSFKDVIDNL
tara:strand:- start:1870 stop:2772 length:903 start_codon:yes stop_codon:yes gene_type:complete